MTEPRLLTVDIAAEAIADIRRAIHYYNEQTPGLGRFFLHEVVQQLGRVRRFPLSYPSLDRHRRRAVLQRFPFTIVYRIANDRIEIVAVCDCRSDRAIT